MFDVTFFHLCMQAIAGKSVSAPLAAGLAQSPRRLAQLRSEFIEESFKDVRFSSFGSWVHYFLGNYKFNSAHQCSYMVMKTHVKAHL